MKLLPWSDPWPQITDSQEGKAWNILHAARPAKWSVVTVIWKVLSDPDSIGERTTRFYLMQDPALVKVNKSEIKLATVAVLAIIIIIIIFR